MVISDELVSALDVSVQAALLAAVPSADPDCDQSHVHLSGRVPSAVIPPSGCRFHTRCPFIIGDICKTEEPPERNMGGDHKSYCHLTPDDLYQIKPKAFPGHGKLNA